MTNSLSPIASLVTIDNNIPLADSRKIAEELGITHKSMMQLIRDYLPEIEEDFGSVRFENAVKSRNRGGDQPRYALLTEHQTYAYMTYSQNTDQARACKRALVKAFMEAKAQLARYEKLLAIHAAERAYMLPHRAIDEFDTTLEQAQRQAHELKSAPDRTAFLQTVEQGLAQIQAHRTAMTEFDGKLLQLHSELS